MKKFPLFLAVVLLSPLTLTNSQCSKECGFALCDMVTEIVVDGVLTVVAGAPFNIPNLIKNLPETANACRGDILETLSAKASQSRIKIDYDINNNGSYAQNVKNSPFDVPEILPGDGAEEMYSFLLMNPELTSS
ncbi:MAG: hypothetical protein IPJ40_24285 [Saprospirales bacterium]|nr:hypothetical protein [Saprospirales bacterium]